METIQLKIKEIVCGDKDKQKARITRCLAQRLSASESPEIM